MPQDSLLPVVPEVDVQARPEWLLPLDPAVIPELLVVLAADMVVVLEELNLALPAADNLELLVAHTAVEANPVLRCKALLAVDSQAHPVVRMVVEASRGLRCKVLLAVDNLAHPAVHTEEVDNLVPCLGKEPPAHQEARMVGIPEIPPAEHRRHPAAVDHNLPVTHQAAATLQAAAIRRCKS